MSPEGRWYPALVMVLALLFLAGGSVLMITMLATVLGPFSIEVAQSPHSTRNGVGVWIPPSARTLSDFDAAAVEQAYRATFPAPFEVVVSERLDDLMARGVTVVAVADARALVDRELEQLESLSSGRVLLSGWIGIWSSDGQWIGTNRMAQLLQESSIETIPYVSALFLAAGVRGPLSTGLEPGQRIALPKPFEAPGLRMQNAELHWADWRLRASVPNAGASKRWTRGDDRFVWIASPPFLDLDAADGAALQRAYQNAHAWLTQTPTHELLAWPKGTPFAGLLALDAEDRFSNAENVAALSRALDFPITYMLLSSAAVQHPELVERLRASGEVGSHADVHDGFAGAPSREQRRRIERSMADLRSLGATSIRGFRAPFESEDDSTSEVVRQLGFAYILGDPRMASAVPRFERADGSLLRMPRTVADDVDLCVKLGLERSADIEAAMLDDLVFIERIGGLYYLSFHTQYFARRDSIQWVEWAARELRRRGAWLARAGELDAWWRMRSRVRTSLSWRGGQRLLLQVSNEGELEARDLVVRIQLQRSVTGVHVGSGTVLRALPQHRHVAGSSVLDLELPAQPPRSHRSYPIDLILEPPAE